MATCCDTVGAVVSNCPSVPPALGRAGGEAEAVAVQVRAPVSTRIGAPALESSHTF